MEMRIECVDCCGNHVSYHNVVVPKGNDPQVYLYNNYYEILEQLGIPNYQCGSCYDSAFRLQFIGVVES